MDPGLCAAPLPWLVSTDDGRFDTGDNSGALELMMTGLGREMMSQFSAVTDIGPDGRAQRPFCYHPRFCVQRSVDASCGPHRFRQLGHDGHAETRRSRS